MDTTKIVNCSDCKGICCRRITVSIDPPDSKENIEEIKWFIVHKGVSIWLERGSLVWYMTIKTSCEYLTKDYKCGIYNNRPKLCREYKVSKCEVNDKKTKEYIFYFITLEEFEIYLKR